METLFLMLPYGVYNSKLLGKAKTYDIVPYLSDTLRL